MKNVIFDFKKFKKENVKEFKTDRSKSFLQALKIYITWIEFP